MTPRSALIGSPVRPSSSAWLEEALSFYAARRILVTGAGGFLGSNLIQTLAPVRCRITPLRREDLAHLPAWRRALDGVDVVFHFAAQTSAARAAENPPEDYNANVLPMVRLLEACRLDGRAPIILFAGTATEAGLSAAVPVNETEPDNPATVYDFHKWMAEQHLKRSVQDRVVRGATLRLTNVYGPGPAAGNPDRGVINRMIANALKGLPLTLYGQGDFVRDYLYVEDAVYAFLAAGAQADRLDGGHFVIGSGAGCTVAEAFDLVASQVGSITGRGIERGRPVEVKQVEPPRPMSPIEMRNFVADSRSFSQATGWLAATSLGEGIVKTARALGNCPERPR
ncbi:MAG: NAD-dependent epimerase/dehydratase family protein [Candidatus Omnitrophica bacterium]|nr:NAD-dependent epimerase/dehydratase family protein [Candidatus Omnitrophota bacterium]